MPARTSIFLLILLTNLWVWRLLDISLVVFTLTVVSCSVFLLANTPNKKTLFVICFSLLLLAQWKTTKRVELTRLTNDEQRIQQTRMIDEYPPVHFTFLGKTVWLPIPHWFEERKESIAFFKIQKNLGEVLDFNLYFFANHPRERVGVAEFEKLPYLFIPLFLLGLTIGLKKTSPLCLLSFLAPIALISLVGQDNPMGPFSLLPFFLATITVGAENSLEKVKKKKHAKVIVIIFLIALFMNVIQQYAYTKF